jgi:ubiquinone/menaquinone biosynthesis C-methylase UbiE
MQTDPNQFKESQRQSWDSVSEGWQKWWKTIENGAQIVSNRLVELAHIKSGDKILDLATGIGEPAITAAKKVVSCCGHRYIATDVIHCKAKGYILRVRKYNGI